MLSSLKQENIHTNVAPTLSFYCAMPFEEVPSTCTDQYINKTMLEQAWVVLAHAQTVHARPGQRASSGGCVCVCMYVCGVKVPCPSHPLYLSIMLVVGMCTLMFRFARETHKFRY